MKLSIIVVNWNTKDLLKQTIDSIYRETTVFPFEIIVVDNNSADGSQELIRAQYDKVRLIENKTNLGFGVANNQGLEVAQGEYLMFLNSDVIVKDRAIEKLVAYLEQNIDIAMVGPQLLNSDGSFQHACRRNLPRPLSAFVYLFGLVKISHNGGDYKREFDDCNISGYTEALSGAAMLFRRMVYEKIGGFDVHFFMYGEDLDFCKRVLEECGRIWYLASAHIVHLGGGSSGKRRIRSILNFYDSMWLYYFKHFKKEHNILLRSLVYVGIRLRLAYALGKNFVKN
ncbi:MAG: glycosyltransferase family 2 protein [bacterium]